jgi:hypothetical protein
MMPGQPGVTHLVNQNAALRPERQPALNENPAMRWLEQTVAEMKALQVGGVPHRAWSDAAVKEISVQIIKEPFQDGSSHVWTNAGGSRFEHVGASHSPHVPYRAKGAAPLAPPRQSAAHFSLLALRLTTVGPVFLHAPADLFLLCRRHRLPASYRGARRLGG